MVEQQPDPGSRSRASGRRGDPGYWAIVVTRSGGMAGIRRQWRADSAHDIGVDWGRLIGDCPWGQVAVTTPGRDFFVWRIEASWSAQTRRATVSGPSLDGPWRDLVAAVQQAADTRPPE